MNKIKYFDPIDFLRVLGTIMVFFLHVSLFSSKLGFQFTNKTWLLQTPAWAGVWIFFIVSGFLIGNGFIEKRYDFSLKGVLKFYCGRLCKIGIPTWLFIFLCLTIIQPEFAIANPEIIWKNLFFIYDSTPGFDGPSAAWYISTLMQLYFIAPFVYKLFDYILEKFNFHLYMSIFLFIVIALLGLFIRLGAYKLNLDWSSKVYVPFYMNLDLFFCGMILNYIIKSISFNIKYSSAKFTYFLVLGIVILNSFLYYKEFFFVYQYIFPTVYILIISVFLTTTKIIKNSSSIHKYSPLNLISKFSKITFGFYLFHSLILSKIYIFFEGEHYTIQHIKLIIISFLITLPFAYCLLIISNKFASIYKNIFKVNKNE